MGVVFASGAAALRIRRVEDRLSLPEVVLTQVMPAVGLSAEHFAGRKVLPYRPTAKAIPTREEGLAAAGGKGLMLAPYLLAAAVVAAALAAAH